MENDRKALENRLPEVAEAFLDSVEANFRNVPLMEQADYGPDSYDITRDEERVLQRYEKRMQEVVLEAIKGALTVDNILGKEEVFTKEQLDFFGDGVAHKLYDNCTNYWEQTLDLGIVPDYWSEDVDEDEEYQEDALAKLEEIINTFVYEGYSKAEKYMISLMKKED